MIFTNDDIKTKMLDIREQDDLSESDILDMDMLDYTVNLRKRAVMALESDASLNHTDAYFSNSLTNNDIDL